MKLYLMRHGEAGFDAVSDFERTLTTRGIGMLDQMLDRERDSFDGVIRVLSSPYRRARQTAEQVALSLAVPLLDPDDAFVPDADVSAVLEALENYSLDGLLLVSHQPLVGKLVATLADGAERHPEPMFPGSVAIIELDWPAAGLGQLVKKIDT